MISFDISKEDLAHVEKIMNRAESLRIFTRGYTRSTLLMDLMACNANGCRMDFERLAEADNFNLLHDLIGIAEHINRKTGKLEGCFLPRFAVTTH